MAPAHNHFPTTFLHPLHAILLSFPIALFTSALLADITFLNTAEMQWSNFSAWLITGGLLFGAPVFIFAIAGVLHRERGDAWNYAILYLVLIAVMWTAGLVNAFQHSRDAWSSVGTTGLVLSIISALTALAAGWVGYSGRRMAP